MLDLDTIPPTLIGLYDTLASVLARDLAPYCESSALLRAWKPDELPNQATLWLDTHTTRFVLTFRCMEGYWTVRAATLNRQYRAGEDWHRGNDFGDGRLNEAWWGNFLRRIVAYTLLTPALSAPPPVIPA